MPGLGMPEHVPLMHLQPGHLLLGLVSGLLVSTGHQPMPTTVQALVTLQR